MTKCERKYVQQSPGLCQGMAVKVMDLGERGEERKRGRRGREAGLDTRERSSRAKRTGGSSRC